MAAGAGHRLHQADRDQDEHPLPQRPGVLAGDALVDRPAQDVRQDRLGPHPEDAEQDAEGDLPALQPRHPEQEPAGGAQVGLPGVGEGEGAHVAPRYGEGGRLAKEFELSRWAADRHVD